MTEIVPTWALLGVAVAVVSAGMMLAQERLKVEGLAVAIWCKVACVAVTLPFALWHGFPEAPLFYAVIAAQAVMWSIADVIMYRAISEIGAGVIARLLPLTVVVSFLMWFAYDPSLAVRYADSPGVSAAILAVLVLTVFFAMQMRKCAVTMRAVRKTWFFLVASCIGVLFSKIAMDAADPERGPMAYTLCEALAMLSLWGGYIAFRRREVFAKLLERRTMRGGLIVGAWQAAFVILFLVGMFHVDNPGYVWALQLLSAVFIVVYHRLRGHDDGSDVRAGLGVVVCTMVLVFLKEQVQ